MKTGAALLVGIDKYTNIGGLRYCSSDADALSSKLVSLKAFSTLRTVTRVITSNDSEPPTRANVMTAFSQSLLSFNPNESDMGFVFYFAGHGVDIDGEPYLLPEDYDPNIPQLTAIPVLELMSAIRQRGVAQRVIILDSCYSGIHRGERAEEIEAFQSFQSSIGRVFDPAYEGTAVLSSASMNERARERKLGNSGHGLFTNAIIDALDTLYARMGEGEDIHVEQLHEHAYLQTVLRSNGQQHPRFFYSVGQPITLFRALAKSRSKQLVSPEVEGVQRKRYLSQLASQNPELQRAAAEELIKYGSEIVDELIQRLGNSRSDVRDWAAFCLGEIHDVKAIVPLLGATRNRQLKHRVEPYATTAIPALGKFGVEIIAPALDYLADHELRINESESISKLILENWDGASMPSGEAFIKYVVNNHSSLIAVCPTSIYVVDCIRAKLKENDSQFRSGNTKVSIKVSP